MPGSAEMGDTLLDELVECLDECRGEIHEELGDYQYRVFTVLRTWSGVSRGDGDFSEVETEIEPRPRVESFTRRDKLEPSGLDEADVVRVRMISLTYTEAELAGDDLAENQQWVIRLKDAYGQKIRERNFILEGSPWADRLKDLGWSMTLLRAPDAESV